MTPHKIQLTNACALLLGNCLNVPDSIKGLRDYKAGCEVIGMIDLEQPKDPDKMAAWHNEPFKELELSEPQREVCKKAITHCADKGIMLRNKHTLSLMMAFGLLDP